MKRTIEPLIKTDLQNKLVLLSGPRQTGKTTLSKQLFPSYDYLNFDAIADRTILQEQAWDRTKDILIFDELYKMSEWKRWLKGIYDKEGVTVPILVTGSAQMDTYRKVGDSLAGRFFSHRLYPLDMQEAHEISEFSDEENFARLWECSGFPEPFLKGNRTFYQRWRRSHLDIILRQDLLDLYAIRDIQAIETLVELLRHRVGSTVSMANLANDLQKDAKTIQRWLTLLENLYVIFKVTPYHRNVARSLLKEPKYYFYDWAHIDDEGARLENLVACALLKKLHHHYDVEGRAGELYFLRTKDGREIDFLTVQDNQPTHLIEVKVGDDQLSKHFKHFLPMFPEAHAIQLVRDLKRQKTYPDGPAILHLPKWLVSLW